MPKCVLVILSVLIEATWFPIATSLIDSDGDGVGDSLDVCAGSDDTIDVDADGRPDCNDPPIETDGDTIADSADQCPVCLATSSV